MKTAYYNFKLGNWKFRIHRTLPKGWYARVFVDKKWKKVVTAREGWLVVEPTKREMQDYLRYAYGISK